MAACSALRRPNISESHAADSSQFGRDISQSVIGSQMDVSYFGIMFLPPLFGLLSQYLSTDIFPWFLLIMNLAFVAAMLFCIQLLKKQGRYLTKVI